MKESDDILVKFQRNDQIKRKIVRFHEKKKKDKETATNCGNKSLTAGVNCCAPNTVVLDFKTKFSCRL